MTNGAKACRQRRWEREQVLEGEFTGESLWELLQRLLAEAKGTRQPSQRTRAHEIAYTRLSMLMKEVIGGRRVEAYKMALARAWERDPLACFDVALLEELHKLIIPKRSWSWTKRASHTHVSRLGFSTAPNLNFNVYERVGQMIVNARAVSEWQHGPDIREIPCGPPLMHRPLSIGCRVT